MNTNRNRGTKRSREEITASSMNPPFPVSLPTMMNTTTEGTATVEGTETASLFEAAPREGPGGRVQGQDDDNHNHNENNSGNTVDNNTRTPLPSSSSPVSSARSNTARANFFTRTAAMINLFWSTSSSSSSPVTSSTVTVGIVTENNETLPMTTASPPPPPIEATTTAAAAGEAPSAPLLPNPQDEECAICTFPFPLNRGQICYKDCCGKMICFGCIIAQKRTLIIGTNVKQPIKGSKAEEQEFMMILRSKLNIVCPFCNAKKSKDVPEFLKRMHTRIEKYNDPNAMNVLGYSYGKGDVGLRKNLKKAAALFKRSYDLGHPVAAFYLSLLHDKHIPDKVLKKHYAEEGVRRGHIGCMCILGTIAAQSGNRKEAAQQYMMAACSGNKIAMKNVKACYRHKLVSEHDLAKTIFAHEAIIAKGENEAREYVIRHLDFIRKRRKSNFSVNEAL